MFFAKVNYVDDCLEDRVCYVYPPLWSRSTNDSTFVIRGPMHLQQNRIIARRAFCIATFKNGCPWVRCPFVCPDFWTVSSINSRLWDNIFGRYNQGIRDHLKSADCQLLSFIGYSVQHATCQKHTFFIKKSTTRKWTIFTKLMIFGSVL